MIHYFILGSKCLPDIAHKHTHIPYSIIPLFEAANQLSNSFSQCKTWKETPSNSYMYLILLWKQVFVHKHHTLHIHLVAKYSIFNMYRMKQKYLILWWKLSAHQMTRARAGLWTSKSKKRNDNCIANDFFNICSTLVFKAFAYQNATVKI